MNARRQPWVLLLMLPLLAGCLLDRLPARGTNDLGLVIERSNGAITILDTTAREAVARVENLGDLSHASAVFSRDGRYAYIFGRDGGLSKVDLLTASIEHRVLQAGNSIGGAISQNGRRIAVSNYEPGGVKIFDAHDLAPVADIPAKCADGSTSRTVGLVDAPGNRFIFSLYDCDAIWMATPIPGEGYQVSRLNDIGRHPYDALLTTNGRFYIAGLFGQDGFALVDLWSDTVQAKQVLPTYGRNGREIPVYKMPHLEGWGSANRLQVVPAVGRKEVWVLDSESFEERTRIKVDGQPVFCIVRPGGKEAWVTHAFPDYGTVTIIDLPSGRVIDRLHPGAAVMHMEFTPRGDEVWMSDRDGGRVVVYDAEDKTPLARIPVHEPSGIFFTARTTRIGL